MSEHSASQDQSPRVVRLEEHVAHTERTIEELSGEIAELNRRLHGLAERLGRMEHRVTALGARDASSDLQAPDESSEI
jgi:uncharacterized coiled-coil protein SlyX